MSEGVSECCTWEWGALGNTHILKVQVARVQIILGGGQGTQIWAASIDGRLRTLRVQVAQVQLA